MKIDGANLALDILSQIKNKTDELRIEGIVPALAIIYAGDNKSSESYIRQKIKKGGEVGVEIELFRFKKNSTTEELINLITKLNSDKKFHGIIIQRPIFEKFNKKEILNSIKDEKDIDGFNKNSYFKVPVAEAVWEIISSVTDPHSKSILVIGKGQAGGKPIIEFLKKKGINPLLADTRIKDLSSLTKKADIIVSAVGKKIITPEIIKKGVILIGVGISNKNSTLYGDYNEEEVEKIASFYTPTPGGVGPVNVAFLLKNVVDAAILAKSKV